MSIPKSFIDQVLDQTDIVDVVGRRVQLNKKGSNYWGVCPFHDDHKPSMAVNQDKQFYYCFVCQASGNSINFLRDYENLKAPNKQHNKCGKRYDGKNRKKL
jgi:DNA primase